MRTVKLALVGTGGIAQVHLRAIADLEDVEVAAVCDLVYERAQKTALRWGIPRVYQDHRELLAKEDVEGIIVCTPNRAHRSPAVDALQAGRHVLVEKPMSATLDDAIAMTRAARETGRILMIALKTRYSPQMQAAKAIADSGALGDLYYAETVAARRCGIPGGSFVRKDTAGLGAVADIGVYSLDAALNLMGHPRPVAVSGVANNLLGTRFCRPVVGSWQWVPEELEVEDFGVAWVRFENGAAMVFKTSWIMHLDDLGGTFFLGTNAGLRLSPLTVYRNEWGLMTNVVPQGIPQVEDVELFRREDHAFAEAICAGKPSPIPPEQMLLTNVIIQGLVDSAQAGHELAVAVPDV